MTSTKTKKLNIEELPQEARKCHICPDMKDKNLLSVPVLCDAGCMCVFCKHKITIIKNNKIIMEGPRDKPTNLWTIPIGKKNQPPPKEPTQTLAIVPTISKYNNKPAICIEPHTANSAYTQRSAAELQAWHHGSLGSPPVATLIDAIKNNRLSTFPGLTVAGVRRRFPKAIATPIGAPTQIQAKHAVDKKTNY